jgi:hypothetical protein
MSHQEQRAKYLTALRDQMEARCVPIGGTPFLVRRVVTPLRLHRVQKTAPTVAGADRAVELRGVDGLLGHVLTVEKQSVGLLLGSAGAGKTTSEPLS